MLTDLYMRAEKQGIEIDNFPMRQIVSVSFPEGWIAIDMLKIESTRAEKVHLAHEIGHIETGSFYNIYSKFDIRARHERRADKRAAELLVPCDKLQEAFRSGVCEVWALAEHFEVTEEFMRKAIDLYTNQ